MKVDLLSPMWRPRSRRNGQRHSRCRGRGSIHIHICLRGWRRPEETKEGWVIGVRCGREEGVTPVWPETPMRQARKVCCLKDKKWLETRKKKNIFQCPFFACFYKHTYVARIFMYILISYFLIHGCYNCMSCNVTIRMFFSIYLSLNYF
jgi:hypothetical protein